MQLKSVSKGLSILSKQCQTILCTYLHTMAIMVNYSAVQTGHPPVRDEENDTEENVVWQLKLYKHQYITNYVKYSDSNISL